MKMKFVVGSVIGLLVLGMVQAAASAAVSKAAFDNARKQAASLHASLIPQASPPVRSKVSASAAAARTYLAKCGQNCDLYKFLSADLKTRFKSLDPQALELLMTLVFAELAAPTGDDSQLANIDLQNNLQKQQQTIQMISNVSKMTQDTAMAVIRKIG